MSPGDVVLAFWQAMQTNDFAKASIWLTDDFEGHWPQSGEYVRGRANFVAVNAEYPAQGQWQFHINALVCDGDQVVTDVSITDGVQEARAITFHTVRGDRISAQREFWPDPYAAPSWRAQWVDLCPKTSPIN